MKEKILETFSQLGFQLRDAEGIGYVFDYEGMRLLCMFNDQDKDFFSIALPSFYEYDEENAGKYCALAERINSTMKYIKAYTLGGSMWLFYEREVLDGENIEDIIQHMIFRLEFGLIFARKAIEDIDASFGKEDEDNGADDASDDDE